MSPSISITHTSHILSSTDDEPPSCYTEKLEVTRECFFIFQRPKDQSDLNLQSRILSYCPPITVGVEFLFLPKPTPPLCSRFHPFPFVSLSTSKLLCTSSFPSANKQAQVSPNIKPTNNKTKKKPFP